MRKQDTKDEHMDGLGQIVSVGEVFHWGRFDPKHKQLAFSYEGSGLSVSRCPEAWHQIARLGGNPLHRLAKAGARFLNMTALDDNQREYLLDMARRSGRLVQVKAWQVTVYDEELERLTHYLYRSAEEAEGEADEAEDGRASIARTNSHEAGPALRYAPAQGQMGAAIEDIAILEWLEDETDLDGAWWFETYDPDTYSAPRGTIFQSRLSSWAVEPADTNISDEDIPDIFEDGEALSLPVVKA